jgi:hypothetical protein
MTRRDPAMVLIFTYLSCGLYGLYWQYKTTEELARVSGRSDLNPGMDLVLSLVTCSLYSFYVYYRNAEIIHDTLTARGIAHENKTQTVLLLIVASFVITITAWLPPLILQDEYNKLAA